MPSVSDQFSVEMAGKALHTTTIGRDARHSSACGINLQAERCQAALGYLADVLTRIVNGHQNSQIDELLPWAYIAKLELKAVA
jgi:hypothetical protein